MSARHDACVPACPIAHGAGAMLAVCLPKCKQDWARREGHHSRPFNCERIKTPEKSL